MSSIEVVMPFVEEVVLEGNGSHVDEHLDNGFNAERSGVFRLEEDGKGGYRLVDETPGL